MSFIEDNERMDVGVEKFNDDHKRMIADLNELYDMVQMDERDFDKENQVVDTFIKHVIAHFSAEEEKFKEYGYDKASEHTKIHLEITQNAIRIQRVIKEDHEKLSTDLLNIVKQMLLTHINTIDVQYKEFFEGKGVK